jgi:hypothetical protein
MDMLGDVFVLVLISLLVIGPLLLMERRDRRAEQALRLQARLQSKADQRLGGETFLVVSVEPALTGARGRVVLSAPARWGWLVQEAWNDIRRATPPGYDLVVAGAADPIAKRAASLHTEPSTVGRAS